jgi:hypothetical protein
VSDRIYVERDEIERLIRGVVAQVGDVDDALSDIPQPADGGPATALLGFIAATGVEAVVEYAKAVRLIGAITDDVMEDMSATDSLISDHLSDLHAELDD